MGGRYPRGYRPRRIREGATDGRLPGHPWRAADGPAIPSTQEDAVPVIVVKMLEGRSVEQKRRLVREITDVVVKFTGAPEDQVDVIIEDYSRENWAKAGTLFCDK
jgi:4-oxalocrotonate tautomerase